MAYTKLIRSGNSIEIWEYSRSLPIRKPYAKTATRRRCNINTPRRADHIRRLSKTFRRIIRANLSPTDAPAFLTLTMLQIVSIKTSRLIYTAFLSRLRNRIGSHIRLIAVPEFQKRGAVHFHCLIWGLTDEQISTESSTRCIQRLWLAGFVDCVKTDGHPKLAGYLSKYMSKTLHDVRLRGEKAFSCTRNVMRPMQVGSDSLSGYLDEIVPVDSEPLQKFEFDTRFMGRCVYKRYSTDAIYDTNI